MACLRELKFRKSGSNIPFENWGAAERGHAVEAWVVERLEDALPFGASLNYHGFSQRSFVDEDNRLSGTPDGVLTLTQRRRKVSYLLEVKSVDPRTNLESWSRPKPQHEAQVQQNMHLLRLDGVQVETALVLYVDASNFQRTRQFEVDFDPSAVERFKTRAAVLFGAASPEDLPAEGLTNGGCTWCAFTERCSAIQQANKQPSPTSHQTPPDLPDFAPRGISEVVRAYAELNAEKKLIAEREAILGDKIKAYTQQSGQAVLRTAKFVAEVKQIAGRKTLDVGAYEKATGVPAEDFYKVGKPSLRLEIKPAEDD
jgi:hypothetical protein